MAHNPEPLRVDGARPSAAWVTGLPADWTTSTTQRLVLLLLACDAYDDTSSPGEDALVRWCGLRARSALYEALGALARPIDGVRPALIERTTSLRKRTRYRLLTSVRPDTSVTPDTSGDVSGYASGDVSGLTDPPLPSLPINNSSDDGEARKLIADLKATRATEPRRRSRPTETASEAEIEAERARQLAALEAVM